MLHLASNSSPQWLARARAHLDEVLIDHAHCEKKAAAAAVKLLFSYPHHRFLQEPLAGLAREELEHFEQVLAHLDARAIRYRSIRPSPYGVALHALTRRDEPARLVDLLLISALIEARSCERFRLLAADLQAPTGGAEGDDEALGRFYEALLASEARHHGVYLDLAAKLVSRPELEARLLELAAAEAEIVDRPCEWVRLHAG